MGPFSLYIDGLAEKDSQLVGSVSQVREKTRLHLKRGEARRIAAEIQSGDAATVRRKYGHGEGAKTDFVLLIA